MIKFQYNPGGWRWKLVLWLTGGRIEAVPMFHQDVSYRDGIVVRLGRPGALNVAYVTDHREGEK